MNVFFGKMNKELIPALSRDVYLQTYEEFDKWKKTLEGDVIVNDELILDYCSFIKEKHGYKSSTIWTKISMIKRVILSETKVLLELPRTTILLKNWARFV